MIPIVTNHLQERAQQWDSKNEDITCLSTCILPNKKEGISIPLGSFNYTLNQTKGFILFELEIGDNGQYRSVSAHLCDRDEKVGCWDVKRTPPEKLDIWTLLSSISDPMKDNPSLIVDYAEIKRTEAMLTNKINFLTKELSLMTFYANSLKKVS